MYVTLTFIVGSQGWDKFTCDKIILNQQCYSYTLIFSVDKDPSC